MNGLGSNSSISPSFLRMTSSTSSEEEDTEDSLTDSDYRDLPPEKLMQQIMDSSEPKRELILSTLAELKKPSDFPALDFQEDTLLVRSEKWNYGCFLTLFLSNEELLFELHPKELSVAVSYLKGERFPIIQENQPTINGWVLELVEVLKKPNPYDGLFLKFQAALAELNDAKLKMRAEKTLFWTLKDAHINQKISFQTYVELLAHFSKTPEAIRLIGLLPKLYYPDCLKKTLEEKLCSSAFTTKEIYKRCFEFLLKQKFVSEAFYFWQHGELWNDKNATEKLLETYLIAEEESLLNAFTILKILHTKGKLTQLYHFRSLLITYQLTIEAGASEALLKAFKGYLGLSTLQVSAQQINDEDYEKRIPKLEALFSDLCLKEFEIEAINYFFALVESKILYEENYRALWTSLYRSCKEPSNKIRLLSYPEKNPAFDKSAIYRLMTETVISLPRTAAYVPFALELLEKIKNITETLTLSKDESNQLSALYLEFSSLLPEFGQASKKKPLFCNYEQEMVLHGLQVQKMLDDGLQSDALTRMKTLKSRASELGEERYFALAFNGLMAAGEQSKYNYEWLDILQNLFSIEASSLHISLLSYHMQSPFLKGLHTSFDTKAQKWVEKNESMVIRSLDGEPLCQIFFYYLCVNGIKFDDAKALQISFEDVLKITDQILAKFKKCTEIHEIDKVEKLARLFLPCIRFYNEKLPHWEIVFLDLGEKLFELNFSTEVALYWLEESFLFKNSRSLLDRKMNLVKRCLLSAEGIPPTLLATFYKQMKALNSHAEYLSVNTLIFKKYIATADPSFLYSVLNENHLLTLENDPQITEEVTKLVRRTTRVKDKEFIPNMSNILSQLSNFKSIDEKTFELIKVIVEKVNQSDIESYVLIYSTASNIVISQFENLNSSDNWLIHATIDLFVKPLFEIREVSIPLIFRLLTFYEKIIDTLISKNLETNKAFAELIKITNEAFSTLVRKLAPSIRSMDERVIKVIQKILKKLSAILSYFKIQSHISLTKIGELFKDGTWLKFFKEEHETIFHICLSLRLELPEITQSKVNRREEMKKFLSSGWLTNGSMEHRDGILSTLGNILYVQNKYGLPHGTTFDNFISVILIIKLSLFSDREAEQDIYGTFFMSYVTSLQTTYKELSGDELQKAFQAEFILFFTRLTILVSKADLPQATNLENRLTKVEVVDLPTPNEEQSNNLHRLFICFAGFSSHLFKYETLIVYLQAHLSSYLKTFSINESKIKNFIALTLNFLFSEIIKPTNSLEEEMRNAFFWHLMEEARKKIDLIENSKDKEACEKEIEEMSALVSAITKEIPTDE